MRLHMLLNITFLSKTSTTNYTLEWFFTSMTTHMLLEIKILAETPFAIRTIKPSLFLFGFLGLRCKIFLQNRCIINIVIVVTAICCVAASVVSSIS